MRIFVHWGLTMIERRQSVRVECELPSKFRNLDPKSYPTRVADALVKNISRGGVRIRVDEFVPVNHELYFYLNLPNHEAIEVRIVAAWIVELPNLRKYELGARFVEMGPEQEDAIEHYQYQTLVKNSVNGRSAVKDFQSTIGADPGLAA